MPRNTKRQVTPLATQPLVGPGFRGLNTELANGTGFFEPEWAVALDNIVFDDRGRLNTRQGYRDVTAVPAGSTGMGGGEEPPPVSGDFNAAIATFVPEIWFDMEDLSSPITNQGLTQTNQPAHAFDLVGDDIADVVFGVPSPTGTAISFPEAGTAILGAQNFPGTFTDSAPTGSIIAVVRSDNTARGQYVFEIANAQDDDSIGRMSVNADGTVRVGVRRQFSSAEFYLQSAPAIDGGISINDGEWHSIIWVKHDVLDGVTVTDPRQIYRLYIDGVRQDTNVNALEFNNLAQDLWITTGLGTQRFHLAAQHRADNVLSNGNASNSWDGEIDQFVYLSQDLTDAEAASLHAELNL